jgi:hypothetical protein
VRPPLASIGAIVAGVAVTALTATLMDMAMQAAGVFPRAHEKALPVAGEGFLHAAGGREGGEGRYAAPSNFEGSSNWP